MRYFGFFGNGYQGWENAIGETAPYGNLNWLDYQDTDFREKLEYTRTQGKFAIVSIGKMLFDYPSVRPREYRSTAFQAWWGGLGELQHVIVGLLIADEPWRTNEKNNLGLASSQVTWYLNDASFTIKTLFNDVFHTASPAIVVTASGGEYDSYKIPTAVDWLGMYRYSYNTHWTVLIFSFLNLLRKKEDRQRVLCVADAFEWPNKPINEDRIIAMNQTWRMLIGWSPAHVIGVAPFLYQTTPMGYGAASMPRVLADIASWSKEITMGASAWSS
jgi:hypothetical protein